MIKFICEKCCQQYSCEQNGVPRICYDCIMAIKTGCPPMKEVTDGICYVCEPPPKREFKVLTKKKKKEDWE